MLILSRKGKPNAVQVDYTLEDAYKGYLNNFSFPKTQSKFLGMSTLEPVSRTMFYKINARFFELVFNAILQESKTFVMPYRLGELRVQKKKMPISLLKSKGKLKIDWAHWRKTGKKKYHLNEHRHYHRYKLYWSFAEVSNIRSYRFDPIRKWHRKLKDILINNHAIDYFE